MEQAQEVRAQELPVATVSTLERMRIENCSGSSKDFKLQSFQLFMRRILSPDSPVRNMLLYHGTGVGKGCSAIQVAEEYILKPEFQDKKVLVLASAAVQESFRTQIFDVTRVTVGQNSLLQSNQCTGRKYIDMLERAQTESLRWENPDNREKLNTIIQSMIDDFYEFRPYQGWANTNEKMRLVMSPADYEKWIHETYDNRLIIVDEAQNLRESEDADKAVSESMTKIVQVARGLTLVLLSATPMYDSFEEILFFFNIFLWNDHKQAPNKSVTVSDIFNKNGDFKTPETEASFRGWCHEYISFLRGENPFTFPFRLPPPDALVAPLNRTLDMKGVTIKTPRKYLPLTVSYLQSPQKEAVEAIQGTFKDSTIPTIVVSPDGRHITRCFDRGTDVTKALFKYAKGVPPFLGASGLPKFAAKFNTILNCIVDSPGICFVYSNYVRGGVQQFAMALEEAGFEPAMGPKMLEKTSGEYTGPPKGKYAFLTSDMREKQLDQLIRRVRSPANLIGQDIKIILGSPLISEGIDFKNVRQIHILDPWYNMSRLEQIIGRGLRTCSHAGLPFNEQNCTVYLHTSRYSDSTKETYDEHMYRVFVEDKASKIAKVKQIISESAVDCASQIATNMLPQTWKDLPIPQKRAQDGETLTLPLSAMSAPTFEDGAVALVCTRFDKAAPTEDYVRPLGAYFDIRDDVFNKIIEMFTEKPIWSSEDLIASENLKYAPEVVQYLLQDAIHTHLKLQDKSGRIGILENRDGVYAFTPSSLHNPTMFERSVDVKGIQRSNIEIPEEHVLEEEEKEEEEAAKQSAEQAVSALTFTFDASEFSDEVKKWYAIDQVMSAADKITLLQGLDREAGEQPVWGKDIFVGKMLAVSPTQIFNEENEIIEPVGTDADALKLWVNTRIEEIATQIKTHDKVLCTLEEQTLKFAAFEIVDEHVSRIKRTNTIKPKACPFFKQPDLSVLVKDCTGHDFPASVKTKETRCIYLSLAVRQAALANSPHVFWVSPEVWSFVSKYSAIVRAKIA
jgi:hypothetical protein